MATTGRKPKPLALHVIEGNLKKMPKERREKHENSPQPSLGLRAPPAKFSADHLAVWSRLIEDCAPGLLARSDYDTFVNYVNLVVARDKAMALYIETGMQVLVKSNDSNNRMLSNPLMRELRRINDQMRPLLVELGLTPMSRSRITVQKPVEEGDELDRFLNPSSR
jgi:P27 family predicted phage terminase small subunit